MKIVTQSALKSGAIITPNTLIHGDCLSVMSHIPDKSVDLILADPPYGTTECDWDSVIDLPLMWAQLERVIKDNGAIVLLAQTPFDKVLGASNLRLLRYEWIYEKPAATGFFNAKKMPLKAHENALVFYKKLPTYNPQMTHGHQRKVSSRRDVGSECYGKAIKLTSYDSTSRYPRSVQSFSRDRGNIHPTQKPLALMDYFLTTYSNPGECVLDFCAGSFTTALSAVNNGRTIIAIEKSKKHFKTGVERVLGACD